MKLFSADDHILEPPNLWSSRVPAKFRETAPHVVEEDGVEYWVYEDTRTALIGNFAAAGRPEEDWNLEPIRYDEMRPGCYDPKERAKDLVSEGMTSSLCFPTVPRFSGVLFASFTDKELARVCVEAWNDYLFDEWCAAVPEIFVPMVILPLWDPPAAATELERCIARGARAVTMPEETSNLGLPSYYSDVWDPIWAVCQEADLPVCMHIGSSGWQPFIPEGSTSGSLGIALGFVPTITHAVGMMYSRVPRQFPNIKLVYSEGGIGWVPVTLERADARFKLHHSWSGDDDLLPSEVCRRNMWFCMMPDEDYGLRNRHEVGLDRILWEADYPHANCPWPGTQADTERFFAGVPEDEVAQIAHGNAEKLFKWRCPDPAELDLGHPVGVAR
jgi:predicted TIM-barrel fold metal-dependent hydrolase